MYKILKKECNTHTITHDFNVVLVAKGMKKLPSLKRRFNTLQANRMSCNYPAIATVAKLFGIDAMPLPDEENQPSGWYATIAYITMMYGDEYALGFERADYPQLRKAA